MGDGGGSAYPVRRLQDRHRKRPALCRGFQGAPQALANGRSGYRGARPFGSSRDVSQRRGRGSDLAGLPLV